MQLISSLVTSFLLATLLSFSSHGEEVIWQEGFETGPGAAKPYRGKEPLEVVEEGGKPFLRVTLPGEQPLEGVRLPLGAVEGNRLMTVSAKLRGSGTVGAMVQASNGWTRLAPITLTDQWQPVTIPRTLKAGEHQPTVYFVSLPKDVVPKGMIFEIAGLEAELAPALSLPQRAVPPQRFEIENYTPNLGAIQESDEVTGVVVNASFTTTEIPFPQTSETIHLYLRYRAASGKDRLVLCTRRGGAKQSIQEIQPDAQGWQWLTFADLSAEEAGEAITVEAWPLQGSSQAAMLDAVVITSEAALDATTLDNTL